MFSSDLDPKNFHTARTKNLNQEMTLEELFLKKYPYRFKRMRRDMRWLRKQMLKRGYNPEDAIFMVGGKKE